MKKETIKKEEKKKTWYQELIPYVIIFIIVVIIRTFIITPAFVSGPSMEPTLYNGDWLIVKKYTKYNRDDIVVFKHNKDKLIKRVVGLPGEHIKCEEAVIYINGEPYSDLYAIGNSFSFEEITLEDDEYFVMGDNRAVSKDSRYFGPINESDIIGTTDFILLPVKHAGKVK